MSSYAVVGRFTRTVYGPFSTVADATHHIRARLLSSERRYEVVVWDDEIIAEKRRQARRRQA